MEENGKSLKKLDARVKHAIDTNAIGFTLLGIKKSRAVEKRLGELETTGTIKIIPGSPGVCYF